jgi:hypothetical protein
MPPISPPRNPEWPQSRMALTELGIDLIERFCRANDIDPLPPVERIKVKDWRVWACAYYRPSYIKICPELCAYPAAEAAVRNWSWPGSTIDRTPYGVVAHELGHHVDMLLSRCKGSYFGDFSQKLRVESGEEQITSYAPNDGEWWAEMFRLFVTNHALLYCVRPRTWELIIKRFSPVSSHNWLDEMRNAPTRIVIAQQRKFQLYNQRS